MELSDTRDVPPAVSALLVAVPDPLAEVAHAIVARQRLGGRLVECDHECRGLNSPQSLLVFGGVRKKMSAGLQSAVSVHRTSQARQQS